MDQVITGRFIKECRKQKGLTQQELADRIGVSDKTVSKWECGNGLPEVSLMLPLCGALGISVNELLTGTRLEGEDYRRSAEEKLLAYRRLEERNNKLKLILEIFLCVIGVSVLVCNVVVCACAQLQKGYAVALVGVAVVVLALCIVAAFYLERKSGYYECKHCGEVFTPDLVPFLLAPHVMWKRYLTCPKCGKKGYCRHVLTK